VATRLRPRMMRSREGGIAFIATILRRPSGRPS
jgi:hypothetical protein